MNPFEQKTFPKFETHAAARCFHCDAAIGQTGKPLFYGFPAGAYGAWCEACKWRTFYDTPDASIKFDAMGNPSACACGCAIPYGLWPVQDYSGFHMCPDCGMV